MTGMTASSAPSLDPSADIVDLTAAIVDVESVSGTSALWPTPSRRHCASTPRTSG